LVAGVFIVLPAHSAAAGGRAEPHLRRPLPKAARKSPAVQFGGEPTKLLCEGNRLIAITSGHYEDVDLGGELSRDLLDAERSKIYLSDTVSDRQKAAVEALLPIAFAGFHRGMLSFTKAPITMNITEKRVTFSGPEASVEMEVLSGFGGKPVKVLNLPSAVFQDYTQYKSVSHKHASDKTTFSYSGTNGFTSTMDVGSKP
jgi:hypothetical protein